MKTKLPFRMCLRLGLQGTAFRDVLYAVCYRFGCIYL